MGTCLGPVVSGSVESMKLHWVSSTVSRAVSWKVWLHRNILSSVPQRFCFCRSEMGAWRNPHFKDELQVILISFVYWSHFQKQGLSPQKEAAERNHMIFIFFIIFYILLKSSTVNMQFYCSNLGRGQSFKITMGMGLSWFTQLFVKPFCFNPYEKSS